MHDTDRTFMETDETFEFSAGEDEEFQAELAPELTSEEVLQEEEVDELAAELLSAQSEEEIDRFLGGMFKKIGGGLFKGGPFKALGGLLKKARKKILPAIGGAGGIGKIAGDVGSMLGLEAEGLSSEDEQWEAAKQFVRLAANAAQTTANAPQSANPLAVAQAALSQAAKRHAPGLSAPGRTGTAEPGPGKKMSGRWVRRGRMIILFGV